ncbi:GNAT family N-acetyltransferase [Albirhodobacter sp. R86504]|jgi:RimJ/RimL family protein N-acetyltransferase|uniref:GNAT family N-acetyltransferase n=1 Tax=Albirhodobacter sp. R86504 TaxID=3093848 RepID=UPI00366F2C5F
MKQFGAPLGDWNAPAAPEFTELQGRFATLERLDTRHAHELYRAYSGADEVFDYLPYGPFSSESGYIRWVGERATQTDPYLLAVRDIATDMVGGVMGLLRIDTAGGVVELGHINLAPSLQGTTTASEAMILLITWAFSSGYRRFEWKCDALNLPSRRAAQRLGLSYEGVFRQAAHYKGRNRDTAWFAATDQDWSALQVAYEAWLRPENFDDAGQQIERLSDLTRLVRVSSDPALAR